MVGIPESDFNTPGENSWVRLPDIDLYDVKWLYIRKGGPTAKVRLTAVNSDGLKISYHMEWYADTLTGPDADLVKEHKPELYEQAVLVGKKYDETKRGEANIKKCGGPEHHRCRLYTASLGAKYYVKHDLGLFDGAFWVLAKRTGTNKKNWETFKLVAKGPVPNKAGYYLEWNGERLARTRDAGLLMEHRPELCKRVIAVLGGIDKETAPTTPGNPWAEFIS